MAGDGARAGGARWSWRLSGVSGLLFVAVSFAAVAVNVPVPGYDEDPDRIAAWFADEGTRYRAGHLLAGLAFLLFYFPFFAGLCERLRLAEGTPAVWSRVAWAGAVISPAAGTTAGAAIVGAALLGDRVPADGAALALAANHYAYVVAGAYGGVVMLAAAVVIVRTRVFARWLGWAGAAAGAAAVVSTAAIVEGDPRGAFAAVNGVAWTVYFLWIVALSVGLVRARPEGTKKPR